MKLRSLHGELVCCMSFCELGHAGHITATNAPLIRKDARVGMRVNGFNIGGVGKGTHDENPSPRECRTREVRKPMTELGLPRLSSGAYHRTLPIDQKLLSPKVE